MHASNSLLLYCDTISDYITVLDWQALANLAVHRFGPKGSHTILCQTWTPHRCWKNVCTLQDETDAQRDVLPPPPLSLDVAAR